jgi:hypothetical protein
MGNRLSQLSIALIRMATTLLTNLEQVPALRELSYIVQSTSLAAS